MTLLLVRHGQASAGAADYDCLSERGTEQCRRLGRWLAGTGHEFDAVLVGGMKRHAQSADALAQAYREASGRALPEPELDLGFNELDHHAIFESYSRENGGREEVQRAARQGLEALAPEWMAGLTHAMTASPRTYQRFTQREGGAVGGIPRRAGLANYRNLGPMQVLDGLWLVGDSIFPGQSTLATAVGGVRTAASISARS